jgi:hypothetical protein
MSRRDFHPGERKKCVSMAWRDGGNPACGFLFIPLPAAGSRGALFADLFPGGFRFDGGLDCSFQHGTEDTAGRRASTFRPARAACLADAGFGKHFGESAFDDAVEQLIDDARQISLTDK